MRLQELADFSDHDRAGEGLKRIRQIIATPSVGKSSEWTIIRDRTIKPTSTSTNND
jgi:hypothetical protein